MTAAVRDGMPDAVFHRDSDRFVPTLLARGPWDPNALHGGPPAALLARAVERAPSEQPMHVARLTIELLRPVPLAPLSVEARIVREGKRVQLVEAAITAADTMVVRATALRVAPTPEQLPASAHTEDAPLPDPAACEDTSLAAGSTFALDYMGFGAAFDMRVIHGRFQEPGPAAYWFRLLVPLVAGEETSPLCRVATVADFGNGISQVLGGGDWVFINPDLTFYLHRQPVGEWVALDAVTRIDAGEGAVAEGTLHDERGRVGRSVQALYVATRP